MQLQTPFTVVTPTVDGDLLAVLARARQAFTLRDLARMIPSRSYNGLGLAADRLADQGIVDAGRTGNVRTYAFNWEHLAAEPIAQLATARARLIDRLVDAFETMPERPVFAALFGSAARGDMGAGSDIDLLIVHRDGAGERMHESASDLAHLVTRWTGNDARPVLYGESQVIPGDPLLRSAADEGVVLVGGAQWLGGRLRGAAA